MRRLNPPKLVTVAVFTTITIIFWIFFSVYNILTTDSQVDVDQRLLQPIDPNINTEILEVVSDRRYYDFGGDPSLGNQLPEEAQEPESTGDEATDEDIDTLDDQGLESELSPEVDDNTLETETEETTTP